MDREKREKWDRRFLSLAVHLSSWSEDVRMKVGAVIVGSSNTIIATGYNGLARGISSFEANRHESEKDFFYEHAERNAIFNAARIGVPIEGATIYSSVFPCAICMRALIQAGISRLVAPHPDLQNEKYGPSFSAALLMAGEANLEVDIQKI